MITPVEIEKMEFKRTLLGSYRREEVEANFLMLKNDYEVLYKENIAFKDRLSVLEDLVQKYKSMEEGLQNALVVAQNTGDTMTKNATEKANNIIKEAELKAEAIMMNVKKEIEHIERKRDELKSEFTSFAVRTSALLSAQSKLLEEYITKE